MAESMMQKLTTRNAARGQRPLDKLLALGVTLLTGMFVFAVVFSSLSGTYTTIGQKAAVAVARQTVTSILEKGTDQTQVEAYLKILRGAYPELAAVRLYSGNTAVLGAGAVPAEEKSILGDLATFHKNNNVEEYRIAGTSFVGYMMPLVQSGDYWTMALAFNESAHNSIAKGFMWNNSNVLNEITACNNVKAKYQNALECGSLDPAEALTRYNQELKDAGVDRIVAEKQAQLDAWLAGQQ
jgi:hypothetical protein